ncbi:alpha/beta hydrolase [uncultured Umboniibacter sp.]|uniref:alpha/beta hydrolase n=1 Tax=uncultured Umboniibacter sp. TaxID=1798917 RepID=UPI002615D6F5|nr:alpha/beta hydrolase [uncultured Umboniibacter sp.]
MNLQNTLLLLLAILLSSVGVIALATPTSDAHVTPVEATLVSTDNSVSNVSFGDVLSLDVTHQPTLVRYGESPSQFVEWWQPNDMSQAPVVVFIHGGCWLAEYDLSHANAMASALVDEGFAVWSIEYRRAGEQGGGWPNSLLDVELAIAAMGDFTEQINLDRAILAGHSAGGHLALLVSAEPKLASQFEQIVGLAPISHLVDYAGGNNSCQMATPLFMGGQPVDKPEAYQAADPSQLALSSEVTLILSADDVIVEREYSLLDSVGTQTIPKAGHFDVLHPNTPTFHSFLKLAKEHLHDQ